MELPSSFCWTKFGTEAGEPIEAILRRKERERTSNGGIFLWGIGNSIRPSLLALLDHTSQPEVVFTPMVSAPAQRDVAPMRVITWRAGRGLDGRPYTVPQASLVTSGASASRPSRHYALVCQRANPLLATEGGSLSHGTLRNLRTGSVIGSSQVTSVVQHEPSRPRSGPEYEIAFRASLVYPYLVTLCLAADVEDGAAPCQREQESLTRRQLCITG
jgi:hypothetical protein